jgi:hypothetical protein
MLVRIQRKGTFILCWWEFKLVQPLWKTVWRLLKKLKIELLHDPAVPLLGIHEKECKSEYNKNTCTPMFIAILFTIGKLWKQRRCELRKCAVYTMEHYSAIKNKEILSFTSKQMELESMMLSEVSHAQKDKGSIFSYMWMIDPNIKTSITIYTYICECTYIQNMFPIVGLLEKTRGGGKEEENDRE